MGASLFTLGHSWAAAWPWLAGTAPALLPLTLAGWLDLHFCLEGEEHEGAEVQPSGSWAVNHPSVSLGERQEHQYRM